MRRTPSSIRNLLEVRIGKLRGSKPEEVRLQALYEMRDIVDDAIEQMEREMEQS